MVGEFLFSAQPRVADCYLFAMLLWGEKNGVELPAALPSLRDRLMGLDAVRKTTTYEVLL